MQNQTSIFSIFLAGALFALPALAFADINVSNSGSVYSSTNASANTGGQSAGGGESVSTGGASASSRSATIIEGDEDGGGTVEIETTTEVNGEVKKEVIKQEVPPGGVNIQTSVTADSGAGSASSSVTVNGEVATASASTTSSVSVFLSDLWGGFLDTLASVLWFL